MTVSSTKITAGPFAGNGVSDTFSYTFGLEDKSEIKVFETDTAGTQILLTVDTDYVVNDVGVQTGGTVTRVAGALPSGYEWFMRSDYKETQETEFESQGAFFPDIHEKAFDKPTRLIQQLRDLITRALAFSESYSGDFSPLLPDPIEGEILRYGDNVIISTTLGEILAESATIIADLEMNGSRVTGMGPAVQNNDATTLSQVETLVNQLLSVSGAEGVLPLVQPRQYGDGVKTVFDTPVTVGDAISPNSLFVKFDGVAQKHTLDYVITTGNKIEVRHDGIADVLSDGVTVDITYFKPSVFNPAVDGIVPAIHPRTLGDGSTTVFSTPATGTANVTANSFIIMIDGVAQKPDTDFTIDVVTGDVTFVHNASPDAPALGVSIDITYFRPVVLIGASGTFTSQDSKTITVLNGLITGIV